MKQTLKATAALLGIIAAVVIDNQIKIKNMQTLKEISYQPMGEKRNRNKIKREL